MLKSAKFAYPPFLILLKRIFTKFCNLLLLFNDFFTTIINVYHFLPPSTSFYYVPSTFANFYTTFHQSKTVLFLFLSSDMHQSHHLVGCHAIGIKPLLISFLYVLRCIYIHLYLYRCVISITPAHKMNMNNSFRIIIVKVIIIKLDLIKVYCIKAYINAKKCDNIKGYIDKDYIIIRGYRTIKFFKHFNKPTGNKFYCCQIGITSFITYFLYLLRQRFSIKGSLKTTLSYISRVSHQSISE